MKPSSQTLLIRCDATPEIGTGHVMRCLALAQKWKKLRGPVRFVSFQLHESLQGRLHKEGLALTPLTVSPGSEADVASLANLARSHSVDWLVLDGYHLDAHYRKGLCKNTTTPLLVIDDLGQSNLEGVSAVLNQNFHASHTLYPKSEHTQLHLGPRFAILRDEFINLQRPSQTREMASRLLVTLGGADKENVSQKVLSAISLLPSWKGETIVVVGAQNPNLGALEKVADTMENRIKLEIDSTRIASLMAWADLAITAGGTTTLEMAYMGLPSLILTLAENQIPAVKMMSEQKIAKSAGWYAEITPEQIATHLSELIENHQERFAMNQRLRTYVDGKGSERLIESMVSRKAYAA